MKEHTICAEGLSCPMPLLKAKQGLSAIEIGDKLTISATDAGALRDIPAFIRQTNHTLLSTETVDDVYYFMIQKGAATA